MYFPGIYYVFFFPKISKSDPTILEGGVYYRKRSVCLESTFLEFEKKNITYCFFGIFSKILI